MTRQDLIHRLAELGLQLPKAPEPLAVYVPAVVAGGMLCVSGQLPMKAGASLASGPVGEGGVSVAQAQIAAQQCALNALAAMDQALKGNWKRLQRVVKVEVFVASLPNFFEQHLVANGASELVGKVLGEAGIHARAAVGVPCLPLGVSVEVAVNAFLD